MASALTVLFLGCWLAGQRGLSGQLPATRPSISNSPTRVIAPGRVITIRCQCQCKGRRLFLYKDGIKIRELDAAGDGGEFTIPSARREDGGIYSCRSRSRSEPPNWSDRNDIVQIFVAELIFRKPSISLSPSMGVALGGAVTIRCQGWHQNMSFLLYKDGNPNALQDMEPAGDLAEFLIRNVSWRDAGNYSCYYHHKLYPFIWSHPSDPVELVVAGGTDPTQPGTAPTSTHPGSARPGGSEPSAAPGLTRAIIGRVSAVAAGFLLLLLIFLCYRRTRGRKGPALRQSRESEAAATVHALVSEGKQLDVLPQEPDPGAEGLTYTELDREALQGKRSSPAPAPEPAQPSVYAAINVNWGPHEQSPRGVRAPSPTYPLP